jgi:hypothetical protein
MNTFLIKIFGAGLALLFIILSGLWLSRSGKPFPVIVFTLHKLLTLGTLVFLAMMVYKVHQSTPLQSDQLITIVVTVICFIVMIITGGLLSLEKIMPVIILRIHQLFPYLTVVALIFSFYLLIFPHR